MVYLFPDFPDFPSLYAHIVWCKFWFIYLHLFLQRCYIVSAYLFLGTVKKTRGAESHWLLRLNLQYTLFRNSLSICFQPGKVKIIETLCNVMLLRDNHGQSELPVYSSWECWRCPLAQVQSLLDYCLQLSGVSIDALKPLIVLEGCCVSQDYPRVNHVSWFVIKLCNIFLLDIAWKNILPTVLGCQTHSTFITLWTSGVLL